MKSRLSRQSEKKTTRSFIISILGIIVMLFVLFQFGLPLLTNISLFLSGNQNDSTTTAVKSAAFIAAPVLDPHPFATNSAQISISGSGLKDLTIQLYMNGKMVDKTKTSSKGLFEFEDITLVKGENTIKAKAVSEDDKESDYSNVITIHVKSEAPKLTVDAPSDNQQIKKDDSPIQVKGKTDAGAKVMINDFRAIVDENGSFSYSFPLQNGENNIKIVAIDEAGNKTETSRKVNYSQ